MVMLSVAVRRTMAAGGTRSSLGFWVRGSTLDATGSVYNLRRLQDFEAVYSQVRTGWAIDSQAKAAMWLQNSNGVYLCLKARRRGLSLTLGADGMGVRVGA